MPTAKTSSVTATPAPKLRGRRRRQSALTNGSRAYASRTPSTMGMQTDCAYCSIRTAAITASTESDRLRTSVGIRTTRTPLSRCSSVIDSHDCTVRLSDFDYHLPAELIAQEPAPRGESRLFVLDRATGQRRHDRVEHLASFLRAGDVLVVNDTRVFPARLLGHRVPTDAKTPAHGAVECLLLGTVPSAETGADHTRGVVVDALMHPGQKLKPGARVRFEGDAGALMA